MLLLGYYFLLPYILTLTAGQDLSKLQQELLKEQAYRKKLSREVNNLYKEIDELRSGQASSIVREEISTINEDIESLNNELVKIKKMLKNGRTSGGGSGNGGKTDATEIRNIKQKVDNNTNMISDQSNKVKLALAQLKKDQGNIIRNLAKLTNGQTILRFNMTEKKNKTENKLNAMKRKQTEFQKKQDIFKTMLSGFKKEQSQLVKEMDKMKNSFNTMKKTVNTMKKLNVDMMNAQKQTALNQKQITSQQARLVTEQKSLKKSYSNVDGRLKELGRRQNTLENALVNVTTGQNGILDDIIAVREKVANLNRTNIGNDLRNLSQYQSALSKGLGDLKMEIYNSPCCKGKAGVVNDDVRLKGRMFFATANEVRTQLQWKGSDGSKFIVVVPSAFRKYARDMTVLIASKQTGWYYIDNPYLGIKINRTLSIGNNVYIVARDIHVSPMKAERNSFWVETSNDVTLFVMSTRSRSSDGFHVFPYNSLAKKYVVTTTEPYSRYKEYKCNYRSFISVGSTKDNTKVAFKLNTVGYISYRSRRYHSGHVLTVTLHQYETFELQHCHDLSGTFVTSSASIAVLSGNQCNKIGTGSCSQLVDMMIPIRSLSRDYIIPVLPDRPGSVIHVVATKNNTSVRIHSKTISDNGTSTQNQNIITQTKTINSGQFYEVAINNHTLLAVSSSRTVLVSQFVNGSYKSDPMMIVIPGKSHFQSSYMFSVPAYDFHSRLSVVVETKDLAGLKLDGKSLAVESSSILKITVDGQPWSLFALDVSSGYHQMVHSSKQPFGLVIYGNGHYDGFAFSAGMTIKSG